jgi:N-ethylmaleimide reductase
MSQLFSSTRIGPYSLSHRIVMAPLTRMRSGPGDVPGDLMVEYYTQRATQGGLLIAEATPISPGAIGYLGAPGIYTDEQVAGWKKVVDAVHAKGSLIFLQLFHAGRQSHTDLTPGGKARWHRRNCRRTDLPTRSKAGSQRPCPAHWKSLRSRR